MTTFNERELAFEAKFAHEEEFRFLAAARRDKLFAHWVAAGAGLTGAREDAFVAELLAVRNGPEHDSEILRHAGAQLQSVGIAVVDDDLRAALDRCAAEALKQLAAHPPEHSDIV